MSADTVTMRASETARILACGQSVELSKGKPDDTRDFADRGTQIHRALALMVLGEHDRARAICLPDGLEQLSIATVMWREHRTEGAVIVEHGMEAMWFTDAYSFRATGTPDVLISSPKRLTIWDWKTGFEKTDAATEQGKTYLALASEAWPLVKNYSLKIGWLSHGDLDEQDFSAEEIADHVDKIGQSLAKPDLSRGSHCRYCRAVGTCPAWADALVPFTGGAMVNLNDIPLERWADLLNAAKVAEQRAKLVKDAAMLKMEMDGVAIPTVAGKEMRLTSHERRAFDLSAAFPVIERSKVSMRTLCDRAKMGLGEALAMLGESEETERDLIACGAIRTQTIRQMREYKVKPKEITANA